MDKFDAAPPGDGPRVDRDLPVPRRAPENFPVASRLLAAPMRGAVTAFYDVVRAADDIADDPARPAAARLAALDAVEAALDGAPWAPSDRLRAALAELGRPAAIEHARTMLGAFRADARGAACARWDDLTAYCERSAVPVGRFLLDLHHETDPRARAASEALCTALQILNHLQDMGEDHARLGRRYLPATLIVRAGARVEDLARPALTPALRMAVDEALSRTEALLDRAAPLPRRLGSRRLAAESAMILALARALARRLRSRDMLAARIEPGRGDWLRAAAAGGAGLLRPPRRASAGA